MARKVKRTFIAKIGMNGKKYVAKESVKAIFHCTNGNSKTGEHVGNYNLPIEYTCNHQCECYKLKKCYACNGCYNYLNNQADYSENYNFYVNNESISFINEITAYIVANKLDKFRYFTCGDIPDMRFLQCMIIVAKKNPTVKFWAYTKKYHIVNHYCDIFGVDSIPENLVIIFSHWMNENGTYFPMNNKYNFPTSEFIPYGKEELKATVTHVCPCSDPTVKATCATCEHPCYMLKHGESMALLEHSTSQTRERDKAIKEAKQAL